MAVESARITADVIEANEFPDMVRRYGVRGVPKIVINDREEFVGALPESDYVEQVMAAVAANGGSDD